MTQSKSISAFVLGASGLVGTEIVRLLLLDENISSVTAFVRKEGSLKSFYEGQTEKLIEKTVSFKDLEEGNCEWFESMPRNGNAYLFSALGTTIKQAGSQTQQFLVDYTYQLKTAEFFERAALEKKCNSGYVLISAKGANPKSSFFYPRIKGELEERILKLRFSKIRILRPSLLLGNRTQSRFGEKVAERVFAAAESLGFRIHSSIRPIHARDVARSAIKSLSIDPTPILIYQPKGESST